MQNLRQDSAQGVWRQRLAMNIRHPSSARLRIMNTRYSGHVIPPKTTVSKQRIIVRVMGVVWRVLPVVDVGRVFVDPVSTRWAMEDDRRRIGLVRSVRRRMSPSRFICSSGYVSHVFD